METKQMSMYWWMIKQDVIFSCNGILLGNKEAWNAYTCYNINETWKCYAKWKKSNTKGHLTYNFIYIKHLV